MSQGQVVTLFIGSKNMLQGRCYVLQLIIMVTQVMVKISVVEKGKH